MKTLLTPAIALALTGMSSAVVVFQDDFSTNSLASYATQSVLYNSTPETVTINRSGGSNFLQIGSPITLDSYGATQMTFSFDWAFGASMFGSGFLVQYNDGGGVTGWQTIGSQSYTGTGANDLGNATQPFSVTINEGATYTFTDTALVQIIGTTNSGGKGYHIDNFTVDVDVIPEPSAALLGGLGYLMLLRRRRA